jgi:hypothetical protein
MKLFFSFFSLGFLVLFMNLKVAVRPVFFVICYFCYFGCGSFGTSLAGLVEWYSRERVLE